MVSFNFVNTNLMKPLFFNVINNKILKYQWFHQVCIYTIVETFVFITFLKRNV